MADAGQLLSLLSLESSVQTCSSLHYHQLQHGKHMPRSSSKAVPACNETLAFRIGLLAGDMERLGLNADAAILRGLMRSLPDQPPSCDDRVEKSDGYSGCTLPAGVASKEHGCSEAGSAVEGARWH